MNIENIRFFLTRYKFETCILNIPDGTTFQLDPKYITDIILEKDYEMYHFPYFQITMALPNNIYRKIKKYPFETTLTIDMQAGKYFNPEIKANDDTVFISKIRDTFACYFSDSTPETDENIQKNIEEENGVDNGRGYLYGDMAIIDMLLYKKSYLDMAHTVINDVVSSASLTEIIALCLSKANMPLNKVLMSIAQNNKIYNEFVITPITLEKQIERICNSYGIHEKGTTFFFDFDILYILDKKKECTAFKKNEYKKTYIASIKETYKFNIMGGGYICDREKYNMLYAGSISIDNRSEIHDQNVVLINSLTGEAETSLINDDKKIKAVKVFDTGDNTLDALNNSIKETKSILTVGFDYPDLDFLAPNKIFQFISDDPNILEENKLYRIVSLKTIFEREGGYWHSKTVAEFR